MARPDKVTAVAEIADGFRDSNAAVLTEYRGLTVAQLKTLRRTLGSDTTYAVVKNTLTKRAVRESDIPADAADHSTPCSRGRPPSRSSVATRSRRPRACATSPRPTRC